VKLRFSFLLLIHCFSFCVCHRYAAIESIECRMQEILSPTPEGEYVGSAIVQEVFNIGGTGNIAGSKCRDGIIKKGSNVRVMRGDKILRESKVRTLRNFKVRLDKFLDTVTSHGRTRGISVSANPFFLSRLHLYVYYRLKLTLLQLGMNVV